MGIFGIDIYYGDDDPETAKHINFDLMKLNGIDFVIAKASQGTRPDSLFTLHCASAKTAQLLRGSYHLYDYRLTWRQNYDTYAAQLKLAGDLELLPALDFEQLHNPDGTPIPLPSRENCLAVIQSFFGQFEQDTGYKPMFYCNSSMLHYLSPIPDWLLKYPLWLAAYPFKTGTAVEAKSWDEVPKTFVPYTDGFENYLIWQFSQRGDGLKYGIESREADMNIYNGTVDELRAFKETMKTGAVVTPPLTLDQRVDRLWNAAIKAGWKME